MKTQGTIHLPVVDARLDEAGVNLENLQEFVKQKNFFLPLSMASQGSCLIGGNLATNAGGVNVLKYGNARDLCLGLEVVLVDGTIFNDMKVLKKDLRNKIEKDRCEKQKNPNYFERSSR